MTQVLRSRVETAAALGALYAVCFAIIVSTAAARDPAVISTAIAIDLVITASGVVWWLGVRRRAMGRWAVPLTAGVGMVITRFALHAVLRSTLAFAAIAFEAGALVLVGFRAKAFLRSFRATRARGLLDQFEAALQATGLPVVLAAILGGELTVLSLAVTGWFRRAPADGLSIHRRNSWFLVCGVFVFLIASETAVVHLVLSTWSTTAAWLATALSAYSVVWIIGDAQAMRLYPVRVDARHVRISIGMRWRVEVPRPLIIAVEPTESVPEGTLSLSVLQPSVLVTLREPVVVRGLFGRMRAASRIALSVDDPAALIERIGLGEAADPRR